MKPQPVDIPGPSFQTLERQDGIETASMRLKKGDESGPLGNEHPNSVQVIFVFRGVVEAHIGGDRFTVSAGESAIVPKGVSHRFTGISDEEAVTFNVYVPPAY